MRVLQSVSEKKQQLQCDSIMTFRSDLNSPKMISPLSADLAGGGRPGGVSGDLAVAISRITSSSSVMRPLLMAALCGVTACVLGLTSTNVADAASARVELVPLINQEVAQDPGQNIAQNADHEVQDSFDGADGRIPLPTARPDYGSIWGGRIVGVAGPLRRPDLMELLPVSTQKLAELVHRETGQNVLSEHTLTLSAGDTLAKILHKAKFTAQDVASVSQALARHLNLRRLQIGTQFTAGLDGQDRAVALKVSLPAGRQTKSTAGNLFVDHYVLRDDATPTGDSWHAIKAVRPVDQIAVHAGNEIDLSLYEAARQVNIPLEAFDKFVRVMSFSVDFQRDIQPGDQFELVYENAVDRLTGDVLTSGKLYYAGIILSGKRFGFYRFTYPDGRVGWYDRNGESAVRTLMRTPVNGARLSSRYGMRRHPVTGFNAMHRGIDFAVPTGTPILAAGTGHIEMASWNGSYGKYVRIRHNSTYKTAYAHLSRFEPGLRRGKVVQQGEVIGYVGSTGRSTGPHLHYEILVNNRHVNPLTVQLPAGDGVPAELMDSFTAQVAAIEQKMKDSLTPAYAGVTLQQAALTR